MTPQERVDEAIAEYLRDAEAGRECTPDEFAARHPEIAGELREFFRNYAWMGRLEPLRHPDDDGQFPRPFGDYELEGVMGRGGMGVVYRARHLKQGRTVALKTVAAGRLASGEDVARFRREMNAAKALEHPGIVPVYDVGEFEGVHYYTMRLLDGGSLEDHVGHFRERPREAVRLLVDVARAVRHAHQRAIIHRDLKTGNILLDEERRPLVVDFGLALEMEPRTRVTATGAILGTLPYMAPEQTTGDSRLVTLHVDVYSLGAILYELLTGQPPFMGATLLDTLRKVREEDPRNPRLLNAAVDRDLATICLTCLEKRPSRRYENAGKLIEDLEAWLEGRPISRRPIGRTERTLRWIRRKPGAAALAAMSALLLLVLGAWVQQQRGIAEGRRRERLETNISFARQIAGRIQQRLGKWGRMVEEVAEHSDVIADLSVWNRSDRNVPDVEILRREEVKRLQRFLEGRSHEDLENWQFMDDRGTMIARTPTPEIPERDYSGRDYYQGALRHATRGIGIRAHVSTAYYSFINRCYKVDVSCPILDADGGFVGVVAISVPTSRDWGLPDLGDERRKAVLIARSDPSPPRVKPLPDYIILLHPLLGDGVEPPGFAENPFPVPYDRDCGAELLAFDRSRGDASTSDRYLDPLGVANPEYAGPWLAAFAPVGRTGMVALVQQRDE